MHYGEVRLCSQFLCEMNRLPRCCQCCVEWLDFSNDLDHHARARPQLMKALSDRFWFAIDFKCNPSPTI